MLKQIAWGILLIAGLLGGAAWADEAFEQELFTAVRAGDKAKVEALIAKGANVNSKDKLGTTPLQYAAAYGHKDLAELLIAKGADVNTKDNRGSTSLDSAAANGKKDLAELLIAKGADVNAKDNDGWMPLYFASLYGYQDVAELLIAKGADVNAKTNNGDTPADAAARVIFDAIKAGDNAKVMALIAKGVNVNTKDGFNRTPLHTAALYGKTAIAELLIAKGADVNVKDKNGDTPLLTLTGQMEINFALAELLIIKGADVNAKENDGNSPLNNIVRNEKIPQKIGVELAEQLIAKGADINSFNNSGHTPLLTAVIRGNAEVAKLLTAKGADVNSRSNYVGSESPFTYAVSVGDKNMVELMIANGADVNTKDWHGRTMLQLAEGIRNAKTKQEIINTLQAGMANNISKQSGNDIPKLMVEFTGHSDNEILRAAIINLAQKINPALPIEAEAAAGRAAYIFKNAKSADDTLIAAKELLTAIEAAPWVANYYFNLCTVLEKTPYVQQALHACKLYLIAAPHAADAADMQQRIAGLQYAVDKDKAQMKQRTDKGTGIEGMYRSGGISGTVSGKEIAIKLAVAWQASPPKYQVLHACIENDGVYTGTYDLVSTDRWITMCRTNLHLTIKPEGEGFVEVSDTSGGRIRTTLNELFSAKQKNMAQSVIFSDGERFYVTYLQGGKDFKHAGWSLYETDCNGSVLKQDPHALPDDFIPAETGNGRFISGLDVGRCARQFASKTGYHFGEME